MIIYDWPPELGANAEAFRVDARTSDVAKGREQVVNRGLTRWKARLTIPGPADLINVRGIIEWLKRRGGKS